MPRKRRRKKKKQFQDENWGHTAGEINAPLPKGEEFVDDNVFRLAKFFGIRFKRALFKEAGYECVTCQLQTKKTGVKGRNTMRAHMKKHVNERRAENHLRFYVWTGLLLVVISLMWGIQSRFGLGPLQTAAEDIGWSDVAGPVLLALSVIAASGFIGFEILYSSNPTKWKSRGYFMSLFFTLAILFLETLLVVGVFDAQVDLLWLLSGLIPLLFLAGTRADFARTTLRRSRRKIRPQNYIRRYRAITSDGDEEFSDLQHAFSKMIRSKKINVKKLRIWQQRALITMRVLRASR